MNFKKGFVAMAVFYRLLSLYKVYGYLDNARQEGFKVLCVWT